MDAFAAGRGARNECQLASALAAGALLSLLLAPASPSASRPPSARSLNSGLAPGAANAAAELLLRAASRATSSWKRVSCIASMRRACASRSLATTSSHHRARHRSLRSSGIFNGAATPGSAAAAVAAAAAAVTSDAVAAAAAAVTSDAVAAKAASSALLPSP
jgi:hypothetical protein